jgi:3-hydroxybutyrate dehydrogenase
MQLQGKTAFVTGSTSGIGLGIATALAQQGCAVALNARKVTKETEELTAKLARPTRRSSTCRPT